MRLARCVLLACFCNCDASPGGVAIQVPAGGDVRIYIGPNNAYTSIYSSFWEEGPPCDECHSARFETFGPCQVVFDPRIEGSRGPIVNAGTVTITGGVEPVSLTLKRPDLLYLMPDGGFNVLGPLWQGGETLTFSATGDPAGIPAFSTLLTAPTPITLLTPANGNDIRRDQPLQLEWTGGAAGVITLSLGSFVPMGSHGGPSISCTFPAIAGVGTIPADAFGQIASGPVSGSITALNEETAQAGPFPIHILLEAAPISIAFNLH